MRQMEVELIFKVAAAALVCALPLISALLDTVEGIV